MNLHIRPVTADDRNALGALLRRLPVFEPHEIGVAEELLDETLAGSTDYVIHIAEDIGDTAPGATAGPLIGYVCHGHNPVTDGLYDVYWIAVDPAVQGRGVGRALIAHAEIRLRGARLLSHHHAQAD